MSLLTPHIHFFGASVTSQSIHHKTGEVTGFVNCLESRICSHRPTVKISRTSAGSSLFRSAGICLLEEVLDTSPNIIVLDWHSTGEEYFDEISWNYLVDRILQKNILLLVLFMPRLRFVGLNYKIQKFNIARNQSSRCGLVLCDIYESIGKEFELDKCLRDDVHTNSFGAKKYSDIIYPYLEKMIVQILNNERTNYHTNDIKPPLVCTSKLCISKSKNMIDVKSLQLTFIPKNTEILAIFDCMRGPYSPIIDIYLSGKYLRNFSIWDQWCHFERQSYAECKIVIDKSLLGAKLQLSIKISANEPEYTKSLKEYDFSNIPKSLKMRSIYLIGAEIKG